MDSKRCPECDVPISFLRFQCRYTEYGNAYGERYPDGDEEIMDTNCNDSDYDDYEYMCPECECELSYSFFDEEDEIENNKVKQLIKLVM